MTHEEIKDLIQTFAESGLTSFQYDTENESLTLKNRKETAVAVTAVSEPAPMSAVHVQTEPAHTEQVQAKPVPAEANEKESSQGTAVKAPLAGVFYRAAKPGEEPYVREGSMVKKGQTLGLIEAMKLMSEIPSPCDGTVRQISVENGEFAEYGRTLIVIEEA